METQNQTESYLDALQETIEHLEPLIEMTVGYRTKCCSQGFSDRAAEVMAVKLHDLMLQKMFNGSK